MRRVAAFVLVLVTASALRATDAWFVTPDAGVAVYGPTELTVHVETSDSVLGVEFFVDGRSVGVVTARPYSLTHDVGYDNREHSLRAVATIAGGERVEIARQTGTFRVDDLVKVELRQLYVNVTSGGRRVRDLEEGDFRIFDAGERQKIVTFEHGDIPMTAVLLLDCSGSMEGERFGAALHGARTFLDSMAPLDEAKLLLFSDRLLGATPFTRDRELMEATLSSVAPVGGTAINDYLFASLKALDGRQGRRVVVLFTDGLDLHSLLTMQDVLWKAQRSQAVVYWIYLRESDEHGPPKFNTAWRGFEANLEEFNLLSRAVRQSGGRIAELDSADELEGAFADIVEELRDQYVLGYYPHETRRDGSWREVDVRVRRLGAKLRTRQGYIDH
ncbi:MAG: VWA domain-containing protein [Acidobacteria bacterium]|nr:VWA domain-containing protein [Acidobacteriota bacterium]